MYTLLTFKYEVKLSTRMHKSHLHAYIISIKTRFTSYFKVNRCTMKKLCDGTLSLCTERRNDIPANHPSSPQVPCGLQTHFC